jgi:hypothetical protein
MTEITKDYLLALRTFWKDVNFSAIGNDITFMGDAVAPTHEEVIARIDEAVAIQELGLLKEERNALLAECDWTTVGDSPLTDEQKQAWITYRQALRDITESYSSLSDVVWPTKPSA